MVAGFVPSDAVRADVIRILQLWAEARARFGQGGPFLFGSFCAADIFYAPVVSRFLTYDIHVPGFAAILYGGGVGAPLDAAHGPRRHRPRNGRSRAMRWRPPPHEPVRTMIPA